MRNLVEYPITQEEKDKLILSLVNPQGIGDLTPLTFAEILVDFADESYGTYGREALMDLALEYVNGFQMALAAKIICEECGHEHIPDGEYKGVCTAQIDADLRTCMCLNDPYKEEKI